MWPRTTHLTIRSGGAVTASQRYGTAGMAA
jgi:hypothetical protein